MSTWRQTRDKYSVVTKSEYMTDGLCNALLNYSALLTSKQGDFTNYLSQKESYETTLTTKQNELDTLSTDMAIILDNIDVAQATGADTTQLMTDKTNKQSEIDAKQAEIDSVNADIASVDSQIATLRTEVSMESNFTVDQIKELNQFVIEKEWSNENITSDADLYDEGKRQLEKINKPKTTIEIDIVNFLEIVDEQKNWDKLQLGDTITIYYDKLDIYVQAKIIEIGFDHEEGSIKLTIANVKDILNDKDRLIQILYKSISTSNTVDMNKMKWGLAESNKSSINDILNNVWETAKRAINAGVNESVEINRRGITITDPSDPNKMVRMTHGVIGLSDDGGQTFKLAMDATGVYARHLVGQIIAGANLTITNESGTFTFDSNGATISGAALTITNGLPENQINSDSTNKWNSAESNANAYTEGQISNVNTSLSNLQTDIDNFSSDLKITLAEANSLKTAMNQVNAESTDLINVATTLSITTEKTDYSNVLSTLQTEINKWIDKTYPLDITSTDRTNIQSKFQDVQNKKSILVNKITSVRQANSESYTDGQITEVNTSITNLQSDVDDFSSDAKITLAEANSLKTGLNQVKQESVDLVNVATTLSITTEKTNYSTALSNLETEINKWIDQATYPMDITTTDRSNIQTKFESVQNTKSILINKIASTREANATAIANAAQDTANQAQTDANTANNTLADIASDSKLTPSEKQATKKEWDVIVAEKPTIDSQADYYGITTEKSNYDTSYNTLNTYITPLLTDLTVSSDIIGTTFRSNFKDYYDKRQILLKVISNKAKDIADAAQQSADGALKDGDLLQSVKISSQNGVEVLDGSNNQVVQLGAIDITGDGVTDKYGVKATHADGSFTALTQDGLQIFNSGSAQSYFYLYSVGRMSVPGSYTNQTTGTKQSAMTESQIFQYVPPVTITLPSIFKGKQFTAFVMTEFNKTNKDNMWMLYDDSGTETFHDRQWVADVVSYDYANGTFTAKAYVAYYAQWFDGQAEYQTGCQGLDIVYWVIG